METSAVEHLRDDPGQYWKKIARAGSEGLKRRSWCALSRLLCPATRARCLALLSEPVGPLGLRAHCLRLEQAVCCVCALSVSYRPTHRPRVWNAMVTDRAAFLQMKRGPQGKGLPGPGLSAAAAELRRVSRGMGLVCLWCLCVRVWACVCATERVEVRGQLWGFSPSTVRSRD